MARLKKVEHPEPTPPILEVLVESINHWPRWVRILLTVLITIVWIGLGFTLINWVLPNDTFINAQRARPAVLGLAALGMIIFGGGWHLLVGFDWDADQPWQSTRLTAFYIVAGGASFLIALLGMLGSLIFFAI